MKSPRKDQYSDREAKRRFDAALRGAARVGHKPHSEMRIGKTKAVARGQKKAPK